MSCSSDACLIGCGSLFSLRKRKRSRPRRDSRRQAAVRADGFIFIVFLVFFFFCSKRSQPALKSLFSPGSLGCVRRDLLLQTLSEAVVEEEELAVRKQPLQQSVHAVALQQHLQGKVGQGRNDKTTAITSVYRPPETLPRAAESSLVFPLNRC